MAFTNQPNAWEQSFDPQSLLHRMTDRIRRSLELEEILAATVAEVRSFLGTDRVMVYRFDRDESGEVIAESIHEQRLPSLLGLHFPANDIPEYAREMFVTLQQRSIVDVANGKIGLSPLYSPQINESTATENIYYRKVDPCHLQYLTAMGVQSSLVIPILHRDLKQQSAKSQLWGLLVSHHSESRTIAPWELKLLQQVTDQVEIAIAQSNLLSQTRLQQQQQTILNQVSILLHQLPTIQLQTALETTIAALAGTGGRLYIEHSRELYLWGEQPKLPYEAENIALEQHPVWQNWMGDCKPGQVLAITDLYQEASLRVLALAFKATKIRGILLIPLHNRQKFIGVFTIFRAEFDTEILWAGRCEQNQRQQLPQLSFDIWREERKGQALEWKPEDIFLGQALGYHFSMALQQQEMYQQVQALNTNLEQRVQEKTAELEKSLMITKAIAQITQQIGSTLDLETILQTIVREVRPLLNCDRVLIFQILPESNSQVIVEQSNGKYPSVLGIKAPEECFPDEYTRLYLQGRVRAIHNVYTANLSGCHQEFLQSMQVQANLIIPIKMGMQLWGLLIAHQCDAPRDWQDTEIELMLQLADQAAIAIQQAQLYKQSQAAETQAKAKAQQLEQTLTELKHTQTQLIQTEKMSSLGQLVAGIAHEINNPVNFIYGNLAYAQDYTQQLLQLLQLYQSRYPQRDREISDLETAIDVDFVAQDLPKIISSMQIGADRICSIVLSLRNFSRLDEAEYKPVDLHEGVDNTLLILQHRLKSTVDFPGVQILKDYGDLPSIKCYAGQLNQVFMNVISNAIDALQLKADKETFFQPSICISTRVSADNSFVLIRIADNGPGMTEEIKQRIFDPFFTTKPVGKGTGLGLAISYQIIVEKHGGIIECISEVDQGTEFWIELPLNPQCKVNNLSFNSSLLNSKRWKGKTSFHKFTNA
ncbi:MULTISPECIES: GAF domain-containing sensor histidine kinase [Calothrix]|uniref:histidine kinase n=2 Tax=Calothrix TaxID=1186 RepID=A0ABR8ACL1_9CYAN|nr:MULTISPECIES: GAF domain-containing protein [Calothrix]MBD2197499.1 GAF domain-containing protein [Calothrix parietina FACHB-288]MBD2226127.1 GAF domain-containing protein [Calothrix anomala FACHB-343]